MSERHLNTKQTRLFKSLQNSNLLLLLECLGLFFHYVTGPFWTMVISSNMSHNRFKIVVKKLRDGLQKCSDDPKNSFNPDSFKFINFPTTSPETKISFTTCSEGPAKDAIISAISRGLMAAMDAQLADYLSKDVDFATTSAPLTNLVCERHFGHLDAAREEDLILRSIITPPSSYLSRPEKE